MTEDHLSGNLQATGGLSPQERDIHVRVRWANAKRDSGWIKVRAATLDEGIKIVEAMDDVEVVLEASIVPGGVVT